MHDGQAEAAASTREPVQWTPVLDGTRREEERRANEDDDDDEQQVVATK